jgi:uncharacterized repeat protein (TIGR01451 family)
MLLVFAVALSGVATAQDAPAKENVEERTETRSNDNPEQAPAKPSAETFSRLTGKAEREGSVRVIVGLRADSVPEGRLSRTQRANQRNEIESAQSRLRTSLDRTGYRTLRQYDTVPAIALKVSPRALEALRRSPLVTDIAEDLPTSVTQAESTETTMAESTGMNLAESTAIVQAPAMWDNGFTGSGQVIAVLDTGVDSSHPFLSGKVVEEACFTSESEKAPSDRGDCPNGRRTQFGTGSAAPCSFHLEKCKHGTHVAGIAAGQGQYLFPEGRNSGVAKDSNIMPVQVFSNCADAGGDPCTTSYASDQMSALEHVYNLRNVYDFASVNLSLNADKMFPSRCDDEIPHYKLLIDNLKDAGIATVVSSGNNGSKDSISWPACISSAVSVGSTTQSDGLSSFSNSASFLSLLAPGGEVESGIVSSVPGGGFDADWGTSMAAPHVAGAWALLKQKYPEASVDTILSALQGTGTPVTDTRGLFGGTGITKPRINIADAATKLEPGAIVDNGTIKLGINPEGYLNVPGDTPSPDGTSEVGLRYLPTGAEATAPGCECEGWGVADAASGTTGYANKYTDGGANNMTLVDFTSTTSSAVSVVDVGSTFRVTHDYHPSAATPNLYEVDVTIQNTSPVTVDARYRRVMDWDIEPTAFSEYVTVNGGTSSALLFSSDDGFASANPLAGPSGANTGNFVDAGPGDLGALFDFGFGFLSPGESKKFKIFYGAAGTEEAAEAALRAAGAEAFSLAQPSTADGPTLGTPNTFVFGFSGVGGQPALRPADLSVSMSDSPDPATVGRELTYTLKATNGGPGPATNVAVEDVLPANVEFVSASASRGTCDGTATVTCGVGNLASGASATVTIRVKPTASAVPSISNTATVKGMEADPNSANDSVTESTAVNEPDTTPPETNITSGPSGLVNSNSARFSFSSSEANSTFWCKLDSGTFSACASPKSYSGLANGSHTFTVRANDGAGNADATPATRTWTVDTAAPGGTVKINGGAAYTKSASVRLSLSATDPAPASGLAGMRFMNDGGGSWSAWQPYATTKSWTLRNANGTRTVYVQYKDRAGNVSTSALDRIILDTVEPTISGMSPKPGSTVTDTTPTIKATAKDNLTNLQKNSIRLYVNGALISASKYSYSTMTDVLAYNSPRLSKGKKTVKVVVIDAAGNVGARSWYFTIK